MFVCFECTTLLRESSVSPWFSGGAVKWIVRRIDQQSRCVNRGTRGCKAGNMLSASLLKLGKMDKREREMHGMLLAIKITKSICDWMLLVETWWGGIYIFTDCLQTNIFHVIFGDYYYDVDLEMSIFRKQMAAKCNVLNQWTQLFWHPKLMYIQWVECEDSYKVWLQGFCVLRATRHAEWADRYLFDIFPRILCWYFETNVIDLWCRFRWWRKQQINEVSQTQTQSQTHSHSQRKFPRISWEQVTWTWHRKMLMSDACCNQHQDSPSTPVSL